MNSVRLYYIKHQGENDLAQLKQGQINRWLSELSSSKKAAIQRLFHDSDRIASLLASRLLKMCADQEGIEDFCLSDIRYPDNGKPYWRSNKNTSLDFNISHSDKMVVVVVSQLMDVGVDVEKVRELKRLDFKMVLSTDELNQIQETPDLFFNLWSKKEAVVKAANTIGIGRMRDVELKGSQASLDEKRWYLKKMDLDSEYITILATSAAIDEVTTRQVLISELSL